MDTILDMTKVFLSFVCFSLLPTDVVWDKLFSFCSYRVIALAFLGVNGAGHRHNGCDFFMIQCNG